MVENEIKSFIINFFKSLKAEIVEKDGALVVQKVSKEFESYYGRKAPYIFSFDSSNEGEKIDKTHPLIKIISEYLSNKGQTTLVKLDFNIEKEDLLKFLKFNNCELASITKNPEYKSFERFSFQTNFQFLNEKEQLINSIFVDNNYIINFNPEKYSCKEGKKQDFEILDIKRDYALAKEEVKKLIEPKINKISEYLTKKLEREQLRIREHFKAQLDEINEKINRAKESSKHIDICKIEDEKIKLEKEEEFFLKDEEQKHGLNISTSLMNTTIFYYPIFKADLWLKNKDISTKIQVIYNPLTKQLQSAQCHSCDIELQTINLCSSGHTSCSKCLCKCRECGKDYCLKCLEKTCSYCSKKICSKCCIKCLKCGKYYCSSHIKGKYCINCMKRCSSCNEYCENIIKCSCGREFCERCSKNFLDVGKKVCHNCAKTCSLCGKSYLKEAFDRCNACKSEYCNFPGKCRSCRKQLCPKFKNVSLAN